MAEKIKNTETEKELDKGVNRGPKEPKYFLAHRFLEGFVEIDKKLARKGKSSAKAGQEKEEKMGKAPEPWSPTAPPRFKGKKTEELKKSVLKVLEPTEQGRAAERIAKKARRLSKEIEIKWRSLPKLNIYRFETFLTNMEFVARLPDGEYEASFRLERYPEDSFYFHLAMSGELLKNKERIDTHLLSEESICHLFAILNEKWIRVAVIIEDTIQHIETKFLNFYCEQVDKLSVGEQELVRELQKCLEENDTLKGKVSTYKNLLQKTIEFLRSTKGICKSREIKIFREVLEERLREIQGLPPLVGIQPPKPWPRSEGKEKRGEKVNKWPLPGAPTPFPPPPRPDDRLIEYVEKEGGPPPGPESTIIRGR